jgi:hypothetical protein
MGREQQMYVGSQISQQHVALPLANAPLTQVFPWLAASGSRDLSIVNEFAVFAEEALAWAELTLPSALEGWPDEWPSE